MVNTQTYNTEGSNTFTVPANITYLYLLLEGAGGDASSGGGGSGGRVEGHITTTPAEDLNVRVAGQPFNGGGVSEDDEGNERAWGGGRTDVRQGGTSLTDAVAVGAGAGSSGAGFRTVSRGGGGDGGPATGQDGGSAAAFGQSVNGGGGGTQSSGGSGGGNGHDGSFGNGGAGNPAISGSTASTGGAGGGGWYGGGGGGAKEPEFEDFICSGGGGGSNYTDGMDEVISNVRGVRSSSEGLAELKWIVPPDSLSVTSTGDTSVSLSWNLNEQGDDVRIYRSTSSGVDRNNTLVDTIASGATTYTDTGLDEGTEYHYIVVVTEASGGSTVFSGGSNEASGITTLPDPTSLTVTTQDNDSIDLSWTDNATDEDGYEVQFRLTGGSFSTDANIGANSTSHTVSSLLDGRDYEFRVRATTTDTESGFSNTDTATTDLPDVSSISLSSNTEKTIKGSWTDITDNGEYRIEYKDNDDASWTLVEEVGHNTTESSQSIATDGHQYDMRVRSQTEDVIGTYVSDTIYSYLPEPDLEAELVPPLDIKLTITSNDNNTSTGTMRIFRSQTLGTLGSELTTVDPTTTEYTDSTVDGGQIYYYTLRRDTTV